MKIAVLADIHGNIEALETVSAHIEAWKPDEAIVGGDVVNRGPRPRICLDFTYQKQISHAWRLVRGNHEDYVLDQAKESAPRSGPLFDISRNAYWTLLKLDGQVDRLRAMPFQQSVTGPDGSEVRIVHGSMVGNRSGIYPESSDHEIREKIRPAPAVICVGHTHRPLIRWIDSSLVVNVGAVGIPFDGDYRSCYAQLTWSNQEWSAKIIRLEYDQQKAEADYFSTGFIPEGGGLTKLMLIEFRRSLSLIHLFIRDYERAILAKEISLNEAVDRFMMLNNLEDPSS